jgi:hypothetical protein
VLLAFLMTAAIAAATLSPGIVSPYEKDLPGHWCLVCGRLGGADVLQNLVLFLPFGVGLALGGLPPRLVALAALAFSGAIELAQALVIPGRFATVSDVLMNTTGGWLGAVVTTTWRSWLAPTPHVARRLAGATATLWLLALAVSGWALGRDPAPGPEPAVAGDLPYAPEMGWFAGLVHEARHGTVRVAHRGTGPVVVGAATGAAVAGAVLESGSDGRPFVVPMLYVHGTRAIPPDLVIGQIDDAAIVAVRLRAVRLRLRQPTLRIPAVLPPPSGPSDGPLREIAGGYDGGSLHLMVREGGATRARTIPLTVVLGWALVFPIVRVDSAGAGAVTALWLAGFLLPLGYWLAAGVGHTRRGRRAGIAIAAATLAVGLALVPALAGRPATPLVAWGLAGAWTAAGFAAGLGVRARWGRGRHPFHRRAPATTFPA